MSGLVLMSLPNIVSLISRVRIVLGELPVVISSDSTHVRFYRKKEITEILNKINQVPEFISTSISLNPFNTKSRFRIMSNKLLSSSFDDSILFKIMISK